MEYQHTEGEYIRPLLLPAQVIADLMASVDLMLGTNTLEELCQAQSEVLVTAINFHRYVISQLEGPPQTGQSAN